MLIGNAPSLVIGRNARDVSATHNRILLVPQSSSSITSRIVMTSQWFDSSVEYFNDGAGGTFSVNLNYDEDSFVVNVNGVQSLYVKQGGVDGVVLPTAIHVNAGRRVIARTQSTEGRTAETPLDPALIDSSGGITLPASAVSPIGSVLKPANNGFISNVATSALSTQSHAANQILLSPFAVRADTTIDQIGISISTAATVAFRLLIYGSDEATGRPSGSPLLTTSELLVTTAATHMIAISGGFSFAKSRQYWLGFWPNAAVTLRTAAQAGSAVLAVSNAGTPAQYYTLALSQTYSSTGSAPAWSYANSQLATNLPTMYVMRVSG
ncbi:MAG: hypothetical protein NZ518_00070 [Dehalococcoidia bacterium]|nr:hypothetical protein [Dehalococcoidia bacterium]